MIRRAGIADILRRRCATACRTLVIFYFFNGLQSYRFQTVSNRAGILRQNNVSRRLLYKYHVAGVTKRQYEEKLDGTVVGGMVHLT